MDSSTKTSHACLKALVICPLQLLTTSRSLSLTDNVLFPSHCTIRKSILNTTRGSVWNKTMQRPHRYPQAPIWLALNNINTVLILFFMHDFVWEWKCICCSFFCLDSSAFKVTTMFMLSVLTDCGRTIPSNNMPVLQYKTYI